MTTSVLIAEIPEVPSGIRGRQIVELVAAICMILAAICLIYNEVIFSGKTIVPVHTAGVMGAGGAYGFEAMKGPDYYHPDTGASAWVSEPFSRIVASEYAAGRFPLWNSNQGFGSPLLANGQSGALDIFRLPVLLSGSARAWDVYYLLRVLLGGIVAYLFGRLLGLVWSAGVFLAIAYVFSGHFLFLGNNMWVEAYFLLPAILAGTELVSLGRVRLGTAVLVISVALCILVGMPEVTLLVCLTGAAYGLYRVLAVENPLRNWKLVGTRFGQVAGSWLLGIMLAAPLLATLVEFVGQSSSVATNRSSYGQIQEPLSNFIVFFVPYLIGKPLEKEAGNFITTYVGVTTLMFALYGVFPSATRTYRRIVPFWAFATILMIAKIFGAPGINELGKLPMLNITLIMHWLPPIACFGFALLAAFGVHRLVTEDVRPGAASVILLCFAWLTFLGIYVNLNKLANQTTEHYRETVGVALIFATVAWALIQARRFLPGAAVGIACCCAVVFELFIFAPHGVYQNRYNPFVEAPYVQFLRGSASPEPFRIFGADALMYPNFASAFGLEDIRSLDALYIDRYMTYVRNFIAPGVTDRYVGAPSVNGEQPTIISDNPWFDLTGVRYIITGKGSPSGSMLRGGIRGGLLPTITADDAVTGACPGRGKPCVSVEPITIDGVTKPMLFEHPPAATSFRVPITPAQDDLQFALALNPLVWDPSTGDGVGFEVDVESDGHREQLFHRVIDPKNNALDRHWIDGHVDLSRFDGKEISIILITDPLKSSTSDWAGWGDIRLTGSPNGPGPRYPEVYNGEVEIYQNTHAFARAFLVNSIMPMTDERATVETMKRADVEPSQVAIVEGLPKGPLPAMGPTVGTARMRHYDSTNSILDVNTDSQSFLVFTESFYPGWYASINGQPVPIYPTDLAFQGIFVPAGQNVVTFSYRPKLFYVGVALSILALVLLVSLSFGVPQKMLPGRRRSGARS